MDGFSYINIFETKGIEYIVIIIFLLMLIPFWIILNRKKEIVAEMRKAYILLSAKIRNSPQGLYFSKNHTWVFMERSGAVTMGLDNLLLHLTGNVKIVFLKNAGDLVKKGEWLAQLEQEGRSLKVFSPISGKVLNINTLIEDNSGIANEDPYGKGWLFAIKPSAWKLEIQDFFLADETNGWLSHEMQKIRDFLSSKSTQYSPDHAQVILQDGGEVVEGLMIELPEELWQDFQKEFLNSY